MTKLADYVINFLASHGIDRAFLVYGAANGDLVDAFTRTTAISYVACMHEQGAGFAAEGWAKVKGLPGVAMATSGPGGQNLLTPMANFFYDSVPGIFITGQIKTQFLRTDPAIRQIGFQECDIVAMAKPVTKYAVMVKDPRRIRYEMEKAWAISRQGRPGPVLLDIPINVQKAEIDPMNLKGYNPLAEEEIEAMPSWIIQDVDRQVDQLVVDLNKAERPVMLIGGGVALSHGVETFRELSAALKMPCYPTWNALDVVSSDLPYYAGRVGTYGGAGRNFGIQNCDLLLAIGSRISGRITGGNPQSFAREAKKYVVDIDRALLKRENQQCPFDVSIYANAKIFMQRLMLCLDQIEGRWKPWTDQCLKWRRDYDPVRPEHFAQQSPVHPYAFMRKLSEHLPANAIIVGDCGGNIVVTNHAFETKAGQKMITNNGNSPMGFSFAGAMGAWFADPSRPVICIIGDGGMNMNIQEMQTMLNYGVKVKTFILNNHIYGITKAFQETNFEGRAEACGPKGYRPPDFVKIAEAYGIGVLSCRARDDTDAVILTALNDRAAMIVDVDCHEFHTYEPRIVGWRTPIEQMYPYLPRDEFRANMIIDPVDGWETPAMPNNANKEAAE